MEGVPQSSAKAKAVGKPRGRGTSTKTKVKAKVFRLSDVPVDVFYEIAIHLQPMDLLNLARTNKTFRRVLMKRSARKIWQATMKNVIDIPLPPMPDDICEPAWINLLFSHFCHYCLKKGPHTPFWDLRLRLCASCRREDAYKPVMSADHTLRDHFDYEFEEETGNINVFEVMPLLAKDHVEEHVLMFGMYEYRGADYELLKRTLRRASVAERTKIVLERRAALKTRREHVRRYMYDWDLKQRHTRSHNTWLIQLSRRKAIIAKLRELGWGPEIDKLSRHEREEFCKTREVAQFRPLTDRIWSSIKNACIEFMEDARDTHESVEDWSEGIEGWDGSEVLDLDYWRPMVRSSFDPLSDYEE